MTIGLFGDCEEVCRLFVVVKRFGDKRESHVNVHSRVSPVVARGWVVALCGSWMSTDRGP